MHINECLKAVLLSAVKEPVDGAFLLGLAAVSYTHLGAAYPARICFQVVEGGICRFFAL